jgi:hypothetical protein
MPRVRISAHPYTFVPSPHAMTAMEVIASANSTLASHSALLAGVRTAQKSHRRHLRALPAPPTEVLSLPLLPSPPRSPSPTPSASPEASTSSLPYPNLNKAPNHTRGPAQAPEPGRSRPGRPELPPAKKARAQRYATYVPEEETIRNDYNARYVQGGEWPQNWVLGAEPEHRFEECVLQPKSMGDKPSSD